MFFDRDITRTGLAKPTSASSLIPSVPTIAQFSRQEMIQPSQMFEFSFIHEDSQALDLHEIKIVRCREVGVVQTMKQNFQVIVDTSSIGSSRPRVPVSDMTCQSALRPPPGVLQPHGSEARSKLWLWPRKQTTLRRSAGIPEEIALGSGCNAFKSSFLRN